MDFNNIEDLLQKYWKCETTLEEEKLLHDYFQGKEIPEHVRDTAALFHYFDVSKKKSLVDFGFEHRVLEKANAPKKGRLVKLAYNSMRIAAGLAVVILATWFIRDEVRKTTPQEIVDTYDDPKLAFEETKKALLMISKSFGTAEEQAKKINLFNEAQEEIQRKQ
jgi:hypothetical protein